MVEDLFFNVVPSIFLLVGCSVIGWLIGSGAGQFKPAEIDEERERLIDFYLDVGVQKSILEKSDSNKEVQDKELVILKRLIKLCYKKGDINEGRYLTLFYDTLAGDTCFEADLLRKKLKQAVERAEALSYENAQLKTMLQDPKRTDRESEENR